MRGLGSVLAVGVLAFGAVALVAVTLVESHEPAGGAVVLGDG